VKKFVVAAAVAAFGFAGSASAADMPVKAAPLAPAPAYDWSGIYIGGDAGWQSSSIGLSSPTGPLTYSPRHNSFAVGAFVGVQKQFGQFVLGVEGGYLAALVTPAWGQSLRSISGIPAEQELPKRS
jgi:outer membrane immunogenic protein